MNRIASIVLACTLGAVVSASWGDKVYLKEGGVREGIIVGETPSEVRLKIDDGGLVATIPIEKSGIAKIEKGPVTHVPAAPKAVTTVPAKGTASATNTASAAAATLPAGITPPPPTRGFLTELGASIVNEGPSSLSRLPADLQGLWKKALQEEAAGKKVDELETLRILEQAFRETPGGIDRLNAITQHERNETFGAWLASVHLEVMIETAKNGFFDLTDVRETEKPALLGLLKEKTVPALDPLKSYFPPVDDKGRMAPFKPAQLQGITIDNVEAVRDEALLARGLLLAQIKLDPHLTFADRQLLGSELTSVNHIVSRCVELEPAAHAAQLKAEREKKLADEKARAATAATRQR